MRRQRLPSPTRPPRREDDMTDERGAVPAFRPDQLAGFRIGVTSDRRSADLIDAFERRGAAVLHAPTVQMQHAHDDVPVIADTERVIAPRPGVLLAPTSYRVRRWVEGAGPPGPGGGPP